MDDARRDEDEALALANDTQYGIIGYLWTSDVTRALCFTDALDAGMIWVNSEMYGTSRRHSAA